MEYCIYHSRDLDGLTSGAMVYSHQKSFGEDCHLIGYDYGENLDTRKFKGKSTIMIDVSMPMDRMEMLSTNAQQFIWVDHHISAYNDLIKYCEEKGYELTKEDFGANIEKIEVKKMNLIYYYSSKLSACEVACKLYSRNLSKKATDIVQILGQYDTWRNSDDKKLLSDKDWETVVMPVQYYFRTFRNPVEIFNVLNRMSYYGESEMTQEKIIKTGSRVYEYQKIQNEIIAKKYFEFDFEGLRVIALNTTNFNSLSFDKYYHESVHDIMMPFQFDGKNNRWIFSMYTTKDLELSEIAKRFGGGGHNKACGFQLEPKLVHFTDEGILFGNKLGGKLEEINLENNEIFSVKGHSHFKLYETDYMVPNIMKKNFEFNSVDMDQKEFQDKYEKYIITK